MWLDYAPQSLEGLLRQEGLPQMQACNSDVNACSNCLESCQMQYQCRDCLPIEGYYMCHKCTLSLHRVHPLHRLQVHLFLFTGSFLLITMVDEQWNGLFFEKMSLMKHGLVLQLGHGEGRCTCSYPSTLIIVHLTGIHLVWVAWCECEFHSNDNFHHTQLLQSGLYPATPDHPTSAVTFDALHFFHLLTKQSKISFYDFYQTIARRDDNSGVDDVPVGQFRDTCVLADLFAHFRMVTEKR